MIVHYVTQARIKLSVKCWWHVEWVVKRKKKMKYKYYLQYLPLNNIIHNTQTHKKKNKIGQKIDQRVKIGV